MEHFLRITNTPIFSHLRLFFHVHDIRFIPGGPAFLGSLLVVLTNRSCLSSQDQNVKFRPERASHRWLLPDMSYMCIDPSFFRPTYLASDRYSCYTTASRSPVFLCTRAAIRIAQHQSLCAQERHPSARHCLGPSRLARPPKRHLHCPSRSCGCDSCKLRCNPSIVDPQPHILL